MRAFLICALISCSALDAMNDGTAYTIQIDGKSVFFRSIKKDRYTRIYRFDAKNNRWKLSSQEYSRPVVGYEDRIIEHYVEGVDAVEIRVSRHQSLGREHNRTYGPSRSITFKKYATLDLKEGSPQ